MFIKNISKNFIDYFLPLVFVIFIKKLLLNKYYPNTFIKRFNSYNECRNFSNQTTHYLNKELDQKLLTKIDTHKDVEIINYFNIPPLISLFMNINSTILEIGGGLNPIHSYIRQSTGKKIKTIVLERKDFVDAIKKKKINNNEKFIKYIYSLDQIKIKKINYVLFSNSIQYLANYKEIIKKIFYFNPTYISINNTFFTSLKKDFYSLQVNMYPSIFPNKFFSFGLMEKIFKDNGYKIIFMTSRKFFYKYKFKLAKKEKIFISDILFKKIK
jgi:putative methyltransferase (TIGR04325 family)